MIKAFRAKQVESIIERYDSNTYGIYIGYQAIGDCIGPTKIGRTINLKAIERGRAQGGADWWFHSFWLLDSRAETYSVESRIKASLKQYKIKGTQSQTELYSLSLAEAETLVSQLLGPSAI